MLAQARPVVIEELLVLSFSVPIESSFSIITLSNNHDFFSSDYVLNKYEYVKNINIVLSSSLETGIGNLATIHLAASLNNDLSHGLNIHHFFNEFPYLPPYSNKFITNKNPDTSPPDCSTSLAAASAVPPVAIKSSTIITFSPF